MTKEIEAARHAVADVRTRIAALDENSLDLILRDARTHNAWQDKPVPESLLRQLYDLYKWGATSMNIFPMRVVFVTSAPAKERLSPCLSEGNRDKTLAAPVCAILGNDHEFYERLPELFPHKEGASEIFRGKQGLIESSAFRNGTLQGAYLMIAARALGLDCGPMSGFNAAAVDKEFFAGTQIRSNFLCNLGYGDLSGVFPRSPRPAFDTVCEII